MEIKYNGKGNCNAKKNCIGMNALLDAEVRNGMRSALSMNLAAGTSRSVIVHQAKYEGKKLAMYLSFCPCCGAPINRTKAKKRTKAAR